MDKRIGVFCLRSGSRLYLQFLVQFGPQSKYLESEGMPTLTARPHNLAASSKLSNNMKIRKGRRSARNSVVAWPGQDFSGSILLAPNLQALYLVHLSASAAPCFTPGPLKPALCLPEHSTPSWSVPFSPETGLPLLSYPNQIIKKYTIVTSGPFKEVLMSSNSGVWFKTLFIWQHQLPGPRIRNIKKNNK